jgi:hypothetical protein
MKNKTLNIINIVLLILFTVSIMYGQNENSESNEWKLSFSKNDVKVFTRLHDNSKVKEFKAVTTVKASVENILNIVLDASNYPKWMDNVTEAALLKKEGRNKYIIYSRVKIPWPFNDRDQITETVVERDSVSGSVICKVEILPDLKNKDKNVVRITVGNGYWLLEPLSGGVTGVTYSFYADPGGNLPAGIINMFIEDSPYKTLLGLKEIVD